MPLCEEVAFDPLEPADQLVHEAADLGEVAPDGADLLAQPVLERVADAARQRRLELGRGCGERLDLLAGPLERRVDLGRLHPAGSGLVDASLRPLDRLGVHWRRGYRPDRTSLGVKQRRVSSSVSRPPSPLRGHVLVSNALRNPGRALPWRRWTSP